jgi:hypothetical protein
MGLLKVRALNLSQGIRLTRNQLLGSNLETARSGKSKNLNELCHTEYDLYLKDSAVSQGV